MIRFDRSVYISIVHRLVVVHLTSIIPLITPLEPRRGGRGRRSERGDSEGGYGRGRGRGRRGRDNYDDSRPSESTIDFSALISKPNQSGGEWTCSTCTFQNHGALTKCEMCNQPRK